MFLEFDRPDRCIVGTVGPPGNRLFLIQVAQGSRLAAVAVEKQQAQLLGLQPLGVAPARRFHPHHLVPVATQAGAVLPDVGHQLLGRIGVLHRQAQLLHHGAGTARQDEQQRDR